MERKTYCVNVGLYFYAKKVEIVVWPFACRGSPTLGGAFDHFDVGVDLGMCRAMYKAYTQWGCPANIVRRTWCQSVTLLDN